MKNVELRLVAAWMKGKGVHPDLITQMAGKTRADKRFLAQFKKQVKAPEKILLALARSPPLNKYQLCHKAGLKLSYSRIYEGIEQLEKDGLIKAVAEEKARTGLKKKSYSLSLKGYILLYLILDDEPDFMANFRKSYPFLVNKIEFFQKNNLPVFISPEVTNNQKACIRAAMEDHFFELIIDAKTEELSGLLKGLSGDPELYKMAKQILEEQRSYYAKGLKTVEEVLNGLQK
jgi:DNA-binding PadR family transcriptional regulator